MPVLYLKDIECYEGNEFISRAYTAILRRNADSEGIAHYGALLHHGKLRKIDIIVRLRLSPEGRRQNVEIEDFWLKACFSLIRQVPVFGKIVFFPFDFLLAPIHIAHLSQQSAQLQRIIFDIQSRTAGNIQAKLVRLEDENRRLAHALNDSLDIMSALKKHTEDHAAKAQENVETMRAHVEAVLTQSLQAHENTLEENIALMRDALQEHSEGTTQRIDAFIAKQEAERPVPFTELDIYPAFEDRFRGTTEEVLRRFSGSYTSYVDHVCASFNNSIEVLDVACGRGEWLQLMQQKGIQGRGVDSNVGMGKWCTNLGLDVVVMDALEYLKSAEENTVHIITAFHFVEHISVHVLIDFLKLAKKVLVHGGMLVLETPNPKNVAIGACGFYADPSHERPIVPETLDFFVSSAGFGRIETVFFDDKDGKRTSVCANTNESAYYVKRMHESYEYAIIAYKP